MTKWTLTTYGNCLGNKTVVKEEKTQKKDFKLS
jgi:hypothetical protein